MASAAETAWPVAVMKDWDEIQRSSSSRRVIGSHLPKLY